MKVLTCEIFLLITPDLNSFDLISHRLLLLASRCWPWWCDVQAQLFISADDTNYPISLPVHVWWGTTFDNDYAYSYSDRPAAVLNYIVTWTTGPLYGLTHSIQWSVKSSRFILTCTASSSAPMALLPPTLQHQPGRNVKMFYIIKMANSDLFYARRAYASSKDQWENQNNKTYSLFFFKIDCLFFIQVQSAFILFSHSFLYKCQILLVYLSPMRR